MTNTVKKSFFISFCFIVSLLVTSLGFSNLAFADSSVSISSVPTISTSSTSNIPIMGKGIGIIADNEVIMVLDTVENANKLLEDIKVKYVEDGAKTYFKQAVIVQDLEVSADQILTYEQGLELFETGRQALETYSVKSGDTAWRISNQAGITLDRLKELNPGVNPSKILTGQSLVINDHQPFIDILSTKVTTGNESIAFSVEEREDNTLSRGQTKVIQAGVEGEKTVTREITKQNGMVVANNVLSEEVLINPVNKIVARGTKDTIVSRAGSGRFIIPKVGTITSEFGPRWGRNHDGIDIGGNTGDDVVASAGGKVIRASWYSGYGNCIDISHGSGVVTRYGHLSQIYVSVGQNVEQGEVIGALGSTGNSTGPHLHFEIIIGGEAQNPMNYL